MLWAWNRQRRYDSGGIHVDSQNKLKNWHVYADGGGGDGRD